MAKENEHFADCVKFNHSDADVYADPVFTLMFTTTKDDQCWKIIPQGNVDKGNIWAVENAPEGVVGIEIDGDKAMSGKLLTTNSERVIRLALVRLPRLVSIR